MTTDPSPPSGSFAGQNETSDPGQHERERRLRLPRTAQRFACALFFSSAPTALSPRDLSNDSRLAEKFVDFEEL